MKNLTMILGAMFLSLVWAVSTPMAKEASYVGVKDCTKCHKKEKDGKQLAIWEGTEHAKAFETLGTAEAKEDAKKVGVSGDPQKSGECLICHTTGYGEDSSRFKKKFKMEQGVQCEACHGPGGNYKKKKIMKKIAKERGPDGKGKSPTAKKVGLIFPNEKTCKTCHASSIARNGKTFKNPNYEDFDFNKYFEKIKHPIPKK